MDININRKKLESFLLQVVEKIISAFPKVEKIVLFGSYAHGKPSPDSDLDLLIIMRTRKRLIEMVQALDALFPQRLLPMDFVVRTPSEIKKRLTSYFCPFTREVIRSGRILYEASTRRKRLGSKSRG